MLLALRSVLRVFRHSLEPVPPLFFTSAFRNFLFFRPHLPPSKANINFFAADVADPSSSITLTKRPLERRVEQCMRRRVIRAPSAAREVFMAQHYAPMTLTNFDMDRALRFNRHAACLRVRRLSHHKRMWKARAGSRRRTSNVAPSGVVATLSPEERQAVNSSGFLDLPYFNAADPPHFYSDYVYVDENMISPANNSPDKAIVPQSREEARSKYAQYCVSRASTARLVTTRRGTKSGGEQGQEEGADGQRVRSGQQREEVGDGRQEYGGRQVQSTTTEEPLSPSRRRISSVGESMDRALRRDPGGGGGAAGRTSFLSSSAAAAAAVMAGRKERHKRQRERLSRIVGQTIGSGNGHEPSGGDEIAAAAAAPLSSSSSYSRFQFFRF